MRAINYLAGESEKVPINAFTLSIYFYGESFHDKETVRNIP